MPIRIPVIVEKVVEKIVEKIVYIAISLTREFKTAYSIVANPSKPIPQIAVSMMVSVGRFIYALFNMLEKLRFYILANPAKPSGATAGTTAMSLLRSSVKAPKLDVSMYRVSNPAFITPQTLISLVLSVVYGSCVMARKMYPTYSVVSNPSKPTGATVSTTYPSVGVRKSP